MLSMVDMLDYCNLDKGALEAIAEHEHVPLSVAVGLGDRLLSSEDGVCALHSMIMERMRHAVEHGRREHAKELATTYRHLQRTHPLPQAGMLPAKQASAQEART